MIDIAYIINVLTYSKWRKSIQNIVDLHHTNTHAHTDKDYYSDNCQIRLKLVRNIDNLV